MSEYQYYEFQAVDRPLTREEMAELRAISSRAQITPTRLQNVYHYGDFKGDPQKLVERLFDGFVYLANWGSHQCMLRLPRRAIDLALAQRYVVEPYLTLHTTRDHVIVELNNDDDEGYGWMEDDESASWLPALLPLRAELASGDLRALYIAWLAAASDGPDAAEAAASPRAAFAAEGDSDDEDSYEDKDEDGWLAPNTVEPPVPAGLDSLSGALDRLVDFLDVSRDLLAAAAEASPERPAQPADREFAAWVRALPATEKDDLLVRLFDGEGMGPRAELLRRFQAIHGAQAVTDGRRTVAQLRDRAKDLAAVRRRAEAEQRAAERAQRQREEAAARTQREREAAAARARRVASMDGRDEAIWQRVAALAEVKKAHEYDEAVELLLDLRDFAAGQQQTAAFRQRLSGLRVRWSGRPALLRRLDSAGLGAER